MGRILLARNLIFYRVIGANDGSGSATGVVSEDEEDDGGI